MIKRTRYTQARTSLVLDSGYLILANIQLLAWGTVFCASNFTDFSNFISAIKQGGLDKTFDVLHSLIAQLAQDLRMIKVESYEVMK